MEISNMALFFLFTFLCFFDLSLARRYSLTQGTERRSRYSPGQGTIQDSYSYTNRHRYSPGQGSESTLQTYIVHVKQPENRVSATAEDRENWYKSFLPISIESSGEPRMVYSYGNAISGFAARLSADEVKAMEEMDGFVSARPDRLVPVLTTHTPGFLGLHQQMGIWKDSNFGKGVIVGVLDGGVTPNHPSFSDEGVPPPPPKWKGRCEFNASDCNNKLIGARNFLLGAKAMKGVAADLPIDEDGHGTHTASTAVGSFVENVNVLGNANGTAVGMAPYAHLAVYKVCSQDLCANSDILAALDSAVEDGVDVLSLSIGGDPLPFYEDEIAIGSFRAIEKGIFVSCAAGNSGPSSSKLSNEAPWILTVGASNTDRSIRSAAKLGNGEEIDGESLFYEDDSYPSTLLPLVFPGSTGKPGTINCDEGSLNGTDVRGKVVVCVRDGSTGRVAKGVLIKKAGGAGMILMNREQDGFSTQVDVHVLPATLVGFSDASKIVSYMNSTNNPVATIVLKGTVNGISPSPTVTAFSSRGPSLSSPGVLKPDIIGPGASILAAWPFQVGLGPPNTLPTFDIISGTSMSTPHLSGIAALLKSSHPDWSPAAIKSALMTTSDILNHQGKPILDQTMNPADLFAIGAGHVNPSKANNPGLVYDFQPHDYIPYLCGLGYSDTQVGTIARRLINCSNYVSISEGDLNYPSFSVSLGPSQMFTRTVTNVGEPYSSYTVQIGAPDGVYVSVSPSKLYFNKANQKMSFKVSFSRRSSSGYGVGSSPFAQGYLTWVSSKYLVRSPISVTFK